MSDPVPSDQKIQDYKKAMERFYELTKELEQLRKELFSTVKESSKSGKEL